MSGLGRPGQGRRARRRVRRWLPPALLFAALVVVWEGWVRWRHTRTYVLPAPSRVAAALWDTRDLLWGHVVTTVTETVIGVALGTVLGVAVAVLIASSGLARRTVEPLLVASQTIPLIVLAPLLVLWFGFGMTPKVVVVVPDRVLPGGDLDRVRSRVGRPRAARPRALPRRRSLPGAAPGAGAGCAAVAVRRPAHLLDLRRGRRHAR